MQKNRRDKNFITFKLFVDGEIDGLLVFGLLWLFKVWCFKNPDGEFEFDRFVSMKLFWFVFVVLFGWSFNFLIL